MAKFADSRYGLWPVFAERLSKSSVILLDDTQRSGEAEVLRRWAAEADLSVVERQNADSSFAIITRNVGATARLPADANPAGGPIV